MLKSIKRFARTTALAACLALAGGSYVAAKTVPVAAEPVTQAPLMWVVKDADSTIYLLGSFHLIRPDMDWMDARISKAYQGADELWLEIADLDDQSAATALFFKYGGDPEHKLTEGMSESEIAQLDTVLKKYGLTLEIARNFKPWAVALLISVKMMVQAGFDPKLGVDQTFLGMAKKDGKPVKGFETTEQQMAMLGSLDAAAGRQYLMDTLDQEKEGVTLLEQMVTAWRTGDGAKLKKLIVDDMRDKTPALYDRLLVKRNMAWAPKIIETLNGKGTSFIVVGAGHLIGPDSVQAQLVKQGIKAEPVY